MNGKFLLVVLCLLLSNSWITRANPCAEKGTKVFFVNGIFNNQTNAKDNLNELEKSTRPTLSHVKNLQYELAWVEGLPRLIHLALATVQRGVDDFQRFWLWVNGLEKAPDWFEDWIQKRITDSQLLDATLLPRLKKHMELYSNAILNGFEVIVVSHSVGGIYANAALRALADYTPAALQLSIRQRSQENPYYPITEAVIANIQIGTPVSQTVNQSPWVNFKDDQVLNGIRKIVPVLPGNVSDPGMSPQDQRGHSLIPSYLRVRESRDLITQHLNAAHQRFKYPIPFFQAAAAIESPIDSNGTLSIEFKLGKRDITRVDERRDKQGAQFALFRANRYDLRPGTVTIEAETVSDDSKHRQFLAQGWIGNNRTDGGQRWQMKNTRAIARWKLGRVDVSDGSGKNPVQADVIYEHPAILSR